MYTIITLVLSSIFSVIIYIISHLKIKKLNIYSETTLMIILIIFNLFVLIQMIFIISDVHKAKVSLDQSLNKINGEIYPRGIIKHIHHLIK